MNLKPGFGPVRVKQYSVKLKDKEGIKEIISNFLQFELLVECESQMHTPILPVKKRVGKSNRLVQDLRAINKMTEDLHPVVANHYT